MNQQAERGLGSNHVLLGGMVKPPSAIDISWLTVTGNMERARQNRRNQHFALGFDTASAADKFNGLSCADRGLQNRRQQMILQVADIKGGYRIAGRRRKTPPQSKPFTG